VLAVQARRRGQPCQRSPDDHHPAVPAERFHAGRDHARRRPLRWHRSCQSGRRRRPGGGPAGDPINPDGPHRARCRGPQHPFMLALAGFRVIHRHLGAAHPEDTRGQECALTVPLAAGQVHDKSHARSRYGFLSGSSFPRRLTNSLPLPRSGCRQTERTISQVRVLCRFDNRLASYIAYADGRMSPRTGLELRLRHDNERHR
jgi:hypothetical protein